MDPHIKQRVDLLDTEDRNLIVIVAAYFVHVRSDDPAEEIKGFREDHGLQVPVRLRLKISLQNACSFAA
jgi:hypothetical protein